MTQESVSILRVLPHAVSQPNAETFIQAQPQQLCAGKWAQTPGGLPAIQPQEIRKLAPRHPVLVSLVRALETWIEAWVVSGLGL